MATQTNALSVGNNADASRENIRRLMSISARDNHFYATVGDMDDVRASKNHIADYNLPSKITDAEMAGLASEADVTNSTSVPTQVINQTQLYAGRAKVFFNMEGEATPGELGNLAKQEDQLMKRCIKAIDVGGVSNYASVAAAGSTKGKAGSPCTFFGNGDETVADNPGLNTVATGVGDITNGGGYNATSSVSVAIDDDTADGSKGTLTLADIANAVVQIHEATDANREEGEGRLRDNNYLAYIPISAYNALFSSDNTGIAGQNRYNTTIGGEMTSIQGALQVYNTGVGKVAIFPVTDQRGDGSANKNAIVMRGDATDIIFAKRPETVELKSTVATMDVGVTMAWTYRAPHASTGVTILGIKN